MVQKRLEVLSTRFVITSSKVWLPLLKRVNDKLNKLDITTPITNDRQDTGFEFFWQFICKGLLIFLEMYIHACVNRWFVYYLCTVLFIESERLFSVWSFRSPTCLRICFLINKLPPSRCMRKRVTVVDTVVKKIFHSQSILDCRESSAKIDAIIIMFNNDYYTCILPVRDEFRLSVWITQTTNILGEARKSCTELARQIPCYFPSIPAIDSEGMGGGGVCPSKQGMFSFFRQVFWHHCIKIKLNCLTQFGINY